jgi:hypothetical protein
MSISPREQYHTTTDFSGNDPLETGYTVYLDIDDVTLIDFQIQ